MAAPRGQQRATGGVSGIHVWLIAFVALWLVSTVLLVWLYTDQTNLKKTADDLRISNTEAQAGVREAERGLEALAELAVGSADDDVTTATDKVNQFFRRIQDDEVVPEVSAYDDPTTGLLTAMTSLYEAYRGEYEQRVTAQDEAGQLQADMRAFADEKTRREQAFADKEEELVAQVQSLQDALTEYREQRDGEMDGFEVRIDELRQQFSRDLQEQRKENNSLKESLAEYKSRYEELQTRFGELQITPEPLLTARQGDGIVLTAKPGDDVVYINLGRKHRITRGMQFAVYPSDEGIPADGRGKARVEVARVFSETAECVVREVFGRDRILEGDVINNPIYDRSRALTFVVAGQFDFAGDAWGGTGGSEQIEALIRDWGGSVVDTVSARVDFVVLGSPPRRVTLAADATAEVSERQAIARSQRERYATVSESAQSLSVPILTQDVFLRFLGYSGGSQS